MVQDLLLFFDHEAWVAELVFSTLQRINTNHINEELRRSEYDIVWQIHRVHDWLYIYHLTKFQSQPDPWISIRVMFCMWLLYYELIKGKHFNGSARMTPAFSLALYIGSRPGVPRSRLIP